MSYVAQQQQKLASVKSRIAQLTGITEEEYGTAIWEAAIEFLTHYTREDEWSISQLTNTTTFWAWWMNQWNLTDELFVASYGSYVSKDCRPMIKVLWQDEHRIGSHIGYPDDVVMDHAYANMLTKVMQAV